MKSQSMFVAAIAVLSLALPTQHVLASTIGGEVSVVLTAVAPNPIEQNILSQTTPIFATPIGADGPFTDVLAAPIADGPIVTVDAADITGDADPRLDLGFTVTNTFNFDADITVTAVVPLSETFGPGLQEDSSANVSVTDANGAGFSVAGIPGTSLFEGRIDGEIVRSIFDGDVVGTLSQPPGGADGAGFSTLPVSEFLPDAIAEESIGISSTFRLGPGDTLRFDGFFEVTPAVPEPTAVGLLLTGLVLVARRRVR